MYYNESKAKINCVPELDYTQQAFCYGIQILSDYPDLVKSDYIDYYGENTVEHLVQTIIHLEKSFKKLLYTNKPMIISEKEELNFQNETNCYYCKKELGEDRVRDHDHYNGKYRGAAHNKCNLNAKNNKFVPFYFHNGSGYDNHLFFNELIKHSNNEIKLLANTDEKYISFDFGCIRFLDSYRFMAFPLDYSGGLLSSDQCKFLNSHEDLSKINRKGIYPYDYIQGRSFQDIERVMKETELPPRKCFFPN